MAVCLARISRLAPVRKALATTAKKTSQHDERDERAAAEQELGSFGPRQAAGLDVCALAVTRVTSVVAADVIGSDRRRGRGPWPAADAATSACLRRSVALELGRDAPLDSTRTRSDMARTSLSSEETKRIAVALGRRGGS